MPVIAHLTPNEFPLGTIFLLSGFTGGFAAAYVLGRLNSWRLGGTSNGDSDRRLQLPLH